MQDAVAKQTVADMLVAWAALVAPLAAICKLFANDITPDNSTPLGAFTEADSAWGYAPIAVAPWGGAIEDVDGSIRLEPGAVRFDVTTAGHPQTIYGWYLTKADGTVLYSSGRLATPVLMSNLLDSLFATPIIRIPALNYAA